MNLIKFPEVNIVYAENQPEYLPLPAFKYYDKEGTIVCCWKLTPEEIKKVSETGEIWHNILTFGNDLQPQLLSTDKPEFPVFVDKNFVLQNSKDRIKELETAIEKTIKSLAVFVIALGKVAVTEEQKRIQLKANEEVMELLK